MSYNLTEYANTYTNTTVGNVTATPAQTGDIVVISGTLYIDGGVDDIKSARNYNNVSCLCRRRSYVSYGRIGVSIGIF